MTARGADVVVVDRLRTPHGRHGGGLGDVPMITLATHVATALLIDGTVTAGNASQMCDAAAAVLVTSAAARRLGLASGLRIRSVAALGVDPAHMGIGVVAMLERVQV